MSDEQVSKLDHHNTTINNSNVASSNIIHGDLNQYFGYGDPSELIQILKLRAEKIFGDLSREHGRSRKMRQYTVTFMKLHKQHIEALEKGFLAQAHEINRLISDLARQLENDPYWKKRSRSRPDIVYHGLPVLPSILHAYMPVDKTEERETDEG